MATTQFAMVEELASLIKDNLFSKHLVLSIEESLVSFLQDDTSLESAIELQPMSSYDRLLLHRLADIYGFAHESVGEGDSRHLVLERCPETAIPTILVSDILWQYDGYQSPEPAPSQHILRRKDTAVMEATETRQSSTPFEVREAAYLAARERIFSPDLADDKEAVPLKSRNIPVVARRMITHALGKKIPSVSSDHMSPLRKCEQSDNHPPSFSNGRTVVPKKSDLYQRKTYDKPGGKSCDVSQAQSKTIRIQNQERDQIGAAKRIFAHALGLPSTKGNQGLALNSNGSNRPYSRDA